MNSGNKHIDKKLLKRYYSGEMQEAEKNELERAAMDDPFLMEAMEGFESDPGSFDAFYEKKFNQSKKTQIRYLSIGVLLTSLLIITLLNIPKEKENKISDNNNPILSLDDSQKNAVDFEYIPEEIVELVEISDSEMITPQQISRSKKELQKQINYPNVNDNEPIIIDEDIIIPEDYTIIQEKRNLRYVEQVPATYLFDLFVVDYRRIEREKKQISYIQYEFSGTSADIENQTTNGKSDFFERKIDVPYFEYLKSAMENFHKSQYKSALTKFIIINEQYPDDLNALFYGGLCYYNLGKFSAAINHFNLVLLTDVNAFKEESLWYKAKAQIKLNQKDDAKKTLTEIISSDGFYSSDAILLLKTLK